MTPITFNFMYLAVTAGHSMEVRDTFNELKMQRDLLYTPEEEMQHYERFKADVEEAASTDDLPFDRLEELFDNSRPALMQSIADEINSMQNSWIASKDQPRFRGASYGDLAFSRKGQKLANNHTNSSVNNSSYSSALGLPSSFDSRDKFANCADVIGYVRDQGSCGSCVSTAVAGVFNDRLCIKTNGKFNKQLSHGYAVACCGEKKGCSTPGCMGANEEDIWEFAKKFGIPTGGDFVPEEAMRKADGCYPYMFPKCDHTRRGGHKYPACGTPPKTPNCSISCLNKNYKTELYKDLHFVARRGVIKNQIDKIKEEIYTGGSVTASMEAYEDFRYYTSGVYKHVKGKLLGLHALKLIGWGRMATEEYWVAVNSWNEEWGEHGLIRIAFGECRIEHLITYGVPKM